MASVFLSYDREDADRGHRVARALEKAGHSVWWDRRIKSGAQYGREIEEALKRADAVVVLWSEKSIDSAWVRDEAASGRDSNKLVPAKIDLVDPPLGFRQYQTTDLSRWKGRRSAEFDAMLEAIASLPQGSKAEDARPAPFPPQPRRWKLSRPVAVAAALLVAIATGLIIWSMGGGSSFAPVVAVAAADSSPASQAHARDLLVKLGTLQAARPDSIDLLSQEDARRKPALIFQVGRTGRGQGAEANLALTDAKDRSLLWAKDFHDPNGNEADLRQQLAYSAAHVLRCALEARDPTAGRLSRQALKTYLNACAPNPDAGLGEVTAAISSLQQLVREAPHFAGGWGKLLLAETAAGNYLAESFDAMRPKLARHIVEARKLHPNLAEAYIAEVALAPEPRFLERGRLLDQGVERNPDSPELRDARYVFLFSVGRVEDALRDARRAKELDPLSPHVRDSYILALAFAGRMDEALVELEEAERLWPGATGLRIARFTVHLRVGDPREALRLLRSGVLQHDPSRWIQLQESFLQARIDRSPANVEKAVREATSAYNQFPGSIQALSQTLVEFDREEELFRILLNWRRMDIVTSVTDSLFRPKFSDFHKDPRFMQVAKRLGLLDYWRSSGQWPDFCLRADLPYDCKAEAAKLAV